ncbi:hypothetical protein SAMN02799626_04908 [Caulobacter sp. UNC279MFTsu5.1]|nr:hypothetical protein SAMN02799626_04908 [Caulobacter sp. UNC279MFTsu5.1]
MRDARLAGDLEAVVAWAQINVAHQGRKIATLIDNRGRQWRVCHFYDPEAAISKKIRGSEASNHIVFDEKNLMGSHICNPLRTT